MRILFAADVPPDPDSGAAGTEYQTIQALRRLGHEVDDIWAHDLPHRIRHGNLHYLLELPRGYRSAITRKWTTKTYDAVHVNQSHAWLAARDHLSKKRSGVFICRSHGLEERADVLLEEWRGKLAIKGRRAAMALPGILVDRMLRRSDRLAACFSSGYIVSGSLDRDFLIERHNLPPERVACIPQAPPAMFTDRPVTPLTAERLNRLLHVAGFGFWKAPQVVADAVSELAGNPNHKPLMHWVCEKADHEAAFSLLSPQAQLQTDFVAWRPQDELLNLYDQCGIFVCPSYFEGFGKVFLEAMSRGLCVIATRTGGMRDIIKDGINGFHVDFNDAPAIARIVRHLWSNPNQAQAVSAAARETACQYSWERVARETAAFYKLVSEMPPKGR